MQKWQGALRFIGIGWYVALCVVFGAWGGLWLDNKLNTRPLLTIIGLVVGTVIAFYGVYRMILPSIDKKRNKGKS